MKSGFTLLEMLLVLAILVAITAVTIPVVERMVDAHRVHQAALKVRSALSAARLRAVDGGEAVECRFEPDGRYLIVLARDDASIRFGDPGERNPGERDANARQRPLQRLRVELPEPLYFWTADDARQQLDASAAAQIAADEMAAAEADANHSLSGRTWSPPIVFAPNGSSTDARFEIRDRAGRAERLEVRGLTGAASSSALTQRRAG